jgi:NAD(P)-dependent dehydrogenase (short-subunit alcohol dehydrogenase family)
MPNVLITGANRGLGLEFVRQYAADGWRVYACCRTPAKAEALNQLAADSGGKVSVHALDVDDATSVSTAVKQLDGVGIDLLINNAGVNPARDKGLGTIDYTKWLDTLQTNVLGPMRVAEAFIGQLAGQKKLVTISSRMGSIGENRAPDAIVYRSSKAAVNMAMKGVANGVAGKGVCVAVFHPGWVKTDMGGPNAALEITDSVTQMRAAIAKLSDKDNGAFVNYDGSHIAW